MLAPTQFNAPRPRPDGRGHYPVPPIVGARIESIRLQSAMVRGPAAILAWINVANGDASQLEVRSGTPGFQVDWTQQAESKNQVLLSLRVIRVAPTRRRLCLLRFRIGSSSAAASITVLDE